MSTRQFKPGQLKTGLYDITASFAVSASHIPDVFRIITGSRSAEVSVGADVFLIKNASQTVFRVSQSGVVVLATQSAELTGTAPYGGMYFTSGSFFVGLE
jgi:hypothetical protein